MAIETAIAFNAITGNPPSGICGPYDICVGDKLDVQSKVGGYSGTAFRIACLTQYRRLRNVFYLLADARET